MLEIPATFDTLFEHNGKRINCTVGEYFKQIIERLEKVEKYGSASKHKTTFALIEINKGKTNTRNAAKNRISPSMIYLNIF